MTCHEWVGAVLLVGATVALFRFLWALERSMPPEDPGKVSSGWLRERRRREL